MTDLLPGVDGPVVLTHQADGQVVIPVPTPLTRLNFFDGRRLSGADLSLEQDAGRSLLFALGRTGGPGVAHGLDVALCGEQLTLSPGLAVDPAGRILLLPEAVTTTVDGLLDATRGATDGTASDGHHSGSAGFAPCGTTASAPPAGTVEGTTFLLLTLAWAEGLCGNAEVYGAPCEQACVPTTARPYRIDGVVLRLRPLTLGPLPVSRAVLLEQKHLRSRVAAAYFADERAAAGPAMSAALLSSDLWCRGAIGPDGSEVPLAVLARSGRSTLFADAWIARRELLEPPARRQGDGRLAMRPRSVFAAQIAQFQCQLAGLLAVGLPDSPDGRILTDAGVVELPPAGYLPVDPAGDLVRQVTSLLGPGVDLRFVPVPTDQVPHEVEDVRHRNRISLLAGLDDPSSRPDVDVLVPDGRYAAAPGVGGRSCRARIRFDDHRRSVQFDGTARFPARHTDGFELVTAGMCVVGTNLAGVTFVRSLAETIQVGEHGPVQFPGGTSLELRIDHLRRIADEAGRFAAGHTDRPALFSTTSEFSEDEGRPIAVRGSLSCDRDLWRLRPGDTALLTGQLDLLAPYTASPGDNVVSGPEAALFELFGRVEVAPYSAGPGAARRFRFTGQLAVPRGDSRPGPGRSVTFRATATLTERPGSRLFEIFLAEGGKPITLELADDGSVVWALPGDLLRAEFLRDPDVLGPENPLRQRAELSLGLLRGARTTETGFYERARADLFGVVGSPAADPVLTATQDWVAFRRRRVEPLPAAAPPRASSVVAWVAAADNRDLAQRWTKLLHAGEANNLPWRRVRTVLFDPGTARSRTSPDALRHSYADTGAPATLHHVGFGAATGTLPAGAERALAIVDALPPTAVLEPTAAIAPVAVVPSGLSEPETDGGVFLIAYPAPRVAVLQVIGRNDADRAFSDAVNHQRLPVVERMTTTLGTFRMVDGRLDTQALFDATENATNAAVQDREVLAPTPVLWIDPAWAESQPETADQLIAQTKKFVDGIRAQRTPQLLALNDIARVALATGERQALLILQYHTLAD